MKSFSVYYAIDRKTGKRECLGMGERGDSSSLKEQLYADMSDADKCKKYMGGAVYTDYGMVAIRPFKEPAEEPKKEAPKKTRKKVSEE